MTKMAVMREQNILELSAPDRHRLAELIVEQDDVTYEQALVQIEALTQDLENPGFLAAVLQPSESERPTQPRHTTRRQPSDSIATSDQNTIAKSAT